MLILTDLTLLYTTRKSSAYVRVDYINDAASFLSNNTNWGAHDYVRYDIGTFDLETWACQLKDVAGASDVKEDYGNQCAVERAARVIMVPFLLVAWVVVLVGVWRLVEKRGARADGMRTGDEESGAIGGEKRIELENDKAYQSDEAKTEAIPAEKVEVKEDQKTETSTGEKVKTDNNETSKTENTSSNR